VCTENLIRIDCVTETPKRQRDDRALLPVLSENSIRLGIRIVGQNHRMIGVDACNPALAWDVHRRLVQVAPPAESREPVSPSSTQHCFEWHQRYLIHSNNSGEAVRRPQAVEWAYSIV